MNCPKCDYVLAKDNIVKLRENGNIEIIGQYRWCKSKTCNFQQDIDKEGNFI